ncbi:hypothetical protein L198_02114 [Cryptococcus wingfieldii CBS 7118]|uniref:O-methyltransferase n=1 Tax=Cryptococcus wingfieldii CBS 7118 TaxID=1295528 RepID=A0A1E3JX72_9TREE|nr:hypothetical protein L198_02114 [Cryptococcus wingfieldii CBS 7118]ODO05421.1 hypothetical protein L198_02114 [Cryptococcus wingfieldii CBS 7118]
MSLSENPITYTPSQAHIAPLLSSLHALSLEQESQLSRASFGPYRADFFDALMQDKFIALDEDKCWFVYQLLRAKNASVVVEAGTSFGVSTIYLALAVLNNQRDTPSISPTVIATENEPTKASQARAYWREAGPDVEGVIDLREGDLRETLKQGIPSEGVDVLLLDIWVDMALPTLTILEPHFKTGTTIITDNVTSSAGKKGYQELFAYMNDPENGYSNVVLPYKGGLGLSVFTGKKA